MQDKMVGVNVCPLCRPNNHPEPRFKGCLNPSKKEGKLFYASLQLYLTFIQSYTQSSVSHMFLMSAATADIVTGVKSKLCSNYSDLSLPADLSSLITKPVRMDASFHTKFLSVLGCQNKAVFKNVAPGMLCSLTALQTASAVAAAAGKPNDEQLKRKIYDELRKLERTTLPSYDDALTFINDEEFGAAELERAWAECGKALGKKTKEDWHRYDTDRKMSELLEDDPSINPEVAEELALAFATKSDDRRTKAYITNGQSTAFKERVTQKTPKDSSKLIQQAANRKYAKKNKDRDKVRRDAKPGWKCNSCPKSGCYNNRMLNMRKHLDGNPECFTEDSIGLNFHEI